MSVTLRRLRPILVAKVPGLCVLDVNEARNRLLNVFRVRGMAPLAHDCSVSQVCVIELLVLT